MRKRRDEWKTLLTALAELYVPGIKIDWQQFDQPWQRARVDLPRYPFARARHWLEGETGSGGARGPSLHPLLGSKYDTALKSTIFETRFSGDSPSYLKDHVVQGSVIVPAASSGFFRPMEPCQTGGQPSTIGPVLSTVGASSPPDCTSASQRRWIGAPHMLRTVVTPLAR